MSSRIDNSESLDLTFDYILVRLWKKAIKSNKLILQGQVY